jgi:uncharacterized Zn finger protein
MTCPQCGSNRLLVGPAYDRDAVRCLGCGHVWRPGEAPAAQRLDTRHVTSTLRTYREAV